MAPQSPVGIPVAKHVQLCSLRHVLQKLMSRSTLYWRWYIAILTSSQWWPYPPWNDLILYKPSKVSSCLHYMFWQEIPQLNYWMRKEVVLLSVLSFISHHSAPVMTYNERNASLACFLYTIHSFIHLYHVSLYLPVFWKGICSLSVQSKKTKASFFEYFVLMSFSVSAPKCRC